MCTKNTELLTHVHYVSSSMIFGVSICVCGYFNSSLVLKIL